MEECRYGHSYVPPNLVHHNLHNKFDISAGVRAHGDGVADSARASARADGIASMRPLHGAAVQSLPVGYINMHQTDDKKKRVDEEANLPCPQDDDLRPSAHFQLGGHEPAPATGSHGTIGCTNSRASAQFATGSTPATSQLVCLNHGGSSSFGGGGGFKPSGGCGYGGGGDYTLAAARRSATRRPREGRVSLRSRRVREGLGLRRSMSHT